MKLVRSTLPELCAIAAASLLSGAACAQTISALTIDPPQINEGESTTIRVELKPTSSSSSIWCGMAVEFGNGDHREIRIGDNGANDLQQAMPYRYPNPGTYVITVKGTVVVRGLKSASRCSGTSISQSVKVTDAAAASAQRSADEREKLLAQREQALKDREAAAVKEPPAQVANKK